MMNSLALCFVLTALVTGGVLSPKSDNINPNDRDVIVKEGHRVVVVAYEKEGDGSTKVLISAQEQKSKGVVDDAKEAVENRAGGPRELVCDAFGKCKHKIASTLGRTREIVTEKVKEVEEEAKEAVGKVKEVVGGKVKDAGMKVKKADKDTLKRIGEHIEGNVSRKIGEMKEQVKEVEEMVEKGVEALKGGADKATERVGKMAEKAKNSVKIGAQRVTERVGEMAEKSADTVKSGASRTTERAGEMAEKAAHTVKDDSYTIEKVKKAADVVKDSAHRAKEEREEISTKAGDTVNAGVDKVKEEEQKKRKDLRERYGRGEEVLHDIVMFLVWPNGMDLVMGVVYLLGISLVFGMSMWVTFVSSHVLAGALPRQQFGMLQSKIYPVYFRVQSYCIGLALLGHLLSNRQRFFSSGIEMFHVFNLLASLLMALGNLLYLEPKATKVMFVRMKLEKEEGRGRVTLDPRSGIAEDAGDPVAATTERQGEVEAKSQSGRLSEKLKMLNKYSSFLNVLTLTSLSLHLVYVGQRLHVAR